MADRTRIGLLHAHLAGAFSSVPVRFEKSLSPLLFCSPFPHGLFTFLAQRLLVEPAAASASRMIEQLREFISIPSVRRLVNAGTGFPKRGRPA